MNRPIFVATLPRSGSTLLFRLLGSHPQIHAPWGEPHLLPPLFHLGYFGTIDSVGAARVPTYAPKLIEEALHDVVAQLKDGEADYVRALRAYLDAIYSSLLAASGRGLLVDKSTSIVDYWDFFRRLYPDEKVIVLTRNPLAIAFSTRTRLSDPDLPSPIHAEGSQKSKSELLPRAEADTLGRLSWRVPNLCAALKEGHERLHVRYEDLVRNTEETLRRICSFIGVAFDAQMMEYGTEWNRKKQGRNWKLPLGDQYGIHKDTKANQESLEKWKMTMSDPADPSAIDFARRVLKQFTAEQFEAWGYPLRELETEIEIASRR